MKTTRSFETCLDFLRRMAHHIEHKPGESAFKAKAYTKACAALEAHGSLENLEAVPGIGASILSKLQDVIAGRSKALKEVEGFGPPYSVSELTRIPDIGPKRAAAIWESHGISCLEDLRKAIEAGTFTDQKVTKAFYDMQGSQERISRQVVADALEPVLEKIRLVRGIGRVVVPGSFRRHRADVRDIDLLIEVASYDVVPALIAALAKKLRLQVTAGGARKAYMQFPINGDIRKLDINFLETRSWGTGMLHFTGPAAFNQSVRVFAQNNYKAKVSQYDITYDGQRCYFETEKEVFRFLNLPYIIPQHRENHLDITKASPDVTPDYVDGETHCHTLASTGSLSISAMLKAARTDGLQFVGITDHTRDDAGMSEQDARAQIAEIRAIRSKTTVYAGVELDVDVDGKVRYGKSTLSRFDYALIALHDHVDQRPLERLEAAFKALQAASVPAILAHPTNRVIGKRSQVPLDYYQLFKLCRLYNVVIEINGHHLRCDLPDNLVNLARQYKCRFSIGSDTCNGDFATGLGIGLEIARRARVSEAEIINATHDGFKTFLDGESKCI